MGYLLIGIVGALAFLVLGLLKVNAVALPAGGIRAYLSSIDGRKLWVAIGTMVAMFIHWMYKRDIDVADIATSAVNHWFFIMVIAAALYVGIEVMKYPKIMQKVVIWAVVGALVVAPAWVWINSPSITRATRVEVPLASSPQSSWPKLSIPAGGRSEMIPVPPGMHIVMSGNQFLNHNVYTDGRECAFGEPCVAGPLAGNYATNKMPSANIVSYAFAPN